MAVVLLAVASLVSLGERTCAAPAKQTKKPAVPKKATDEFKKTESLVKTTRGRVAQRRPGEFVKARSVAKQVNAKFGISDFADKPYLATLSWVSEEQQTKIYADADKAEAANEWLPDGKIAGSAGTFGPRHYRGTFYFVDGKWVLEEIEWHVNDSDVRMPAGMARPRSSWSTKTGDVTEWSEVFADKAKQE
jgi:hypothetical protein